MYWSTRVALSQFHAISMTNATIEVLQLVHKCVGIDVRTAVLVEVLTQSVSAEHLLPGPHC
jgi:hypothetical protein